MRPFVHDPESQVNVSRGRELIRRTGQSARLWSGAGLLVAGFALMLAAGYLVGRISLTTFVAIVALGSIVGIGGFAYLCVAVRCPRCGARWFWLMASKRREDPMNQAFRNGACPACGHTG